MFFLMFGMFGKHAAVRSIPGHLQSAGLRASCGEVDQEEAQLRKRIEPAAQPPWQRSTRLAVLLANLPRKGTSGWASVFEFQGIQVYDLNNTGRVSWKVAFHLGLLEELFPPKQGQILGKESLAESHNLWSWRFSHADFPAQCLLNLLRRRSVHCIGSQKIYE